MKNKELYIYQKDVDELKDKSSQYDAFLYINFESVVVYDDTSYYYKPHKDLYESDELNSSGYYTYLAQATLYVHMPINILNVWDLIKLFNKNIIIMKVIFLVGAPENTIEQLYNIFFYNIKSYQDMFNSNTFIETKNVYFEQKK